MLTSKLRILAWEEKLYKFFLKNIELIYITLISAIIVDMSAIRCKNNKSSIKIYLKDVLTLYTLTSV